MTQMLTPYGELIQRLDMGGRPGPEYINPFALLFQLCTVSVAFATFLKSCCKGGRVRVIIYADETRPGNALRPDLQCLVRATPWTQQTYKEVKGRRLASTVEAARIAPGERSKARLDGGRLASGPPFFPRPEGSTPPRLFRRLDASTPSIGS